MDHRDNSLLDVELERPILGPLTWDEDMSDLDEAERELESGEGIPFSAVLQEIKQRYEVYAY